jgi:hypothetical protein
VPPDAPHSWALSGVFSRQGLTVGDAVAEIVKKYARQIGLKAEELTAAKKIAKDRRCSNLHSLDSRLRLSL